MLQKLLYLENLEENKNLLLEKSPSGETNSPQKKFDLFHEEQPFPEEQPESELQTQSHKPSSSGSLWNLNRLRTCFDDILPPSAVGLSQSKLYLGSSKSVFCLQKEHANLGSVSYHLHGEAKVWYGILPPDNNRIIQYLKKKYDTEYAKCPEAHQHKTFFLDLLELKRFFPQLKIFKVVQPVGHYLITGPEVFYQGFNLGFNLTQVSNFGTAAWKRSWRQAKDCLCLPSIWNTKNMLMNHRKERFGAFEDALQCRKKVEAILTKEMLPFRRILNLDLNSFHFAKLRANSFAVITSTKDFGMVESYLANLAERSEDNKFILVPTPDSPQSNGTYTWRLYRPELKLSPQNSYKQAMEKLQKKFKNNQGKVYLFSKEEKPYKGENELETPSSLEEETQKRFHENEVEKLSYKRKSKKSIQNKNLKNGTKKPKSNRKNGESQKNQKMPAEESDNDTDEFAKAFQNDDDSDDYYDEENNANPKMINLNRLVSNNKRYALVLPHCLIMPRYASAEKGQIAKQNKNDVLRPELFKNINSLELAEICHQLRGTNLRVLSKVTNHFHPKRPIRIPSPPEENCSIISVFFGPYSDQKEVDFVLVDGNGIVQFQTSIGTCPKERFGYWDKIVRSFVYNKNSLLVCPDFREFQKLFCINEDTLEPINKRQTTKVRGDLMNLLGYKEELSRVDFTKCTLADFARFQRYYCMKPQLYSLGDLSYFQEFSRTPKERDFLLCYAEQEGSEYWVLCLIDQFGHCVLMRNSNKWLEDLDTNVRRLMEVVHITDKIYYYNDQGRFKHFNQLRFFFVDAVIPTGKRWKETTEENLLKEGKELYGSLHWKNRHITKYAPPQEKPAKFLSL